MTTTRLEGRKIDVTGQDVPNGYGDGHLRYHPGSFLAVAGGIYAAGHEPMSSDQYDSARAAAVGRAAKLLTTMSPVEVVVSDLDGVRVRLVAYLPGTDHEVGRADSTDRRRLLP